MNVLIHGNKLSLGVVYLKVLLARSQRKFAEICLLALLYPFFECKLSRTIERVCLKFCLGVLLKLVDTWQFWVKAENNIRFHEASPICTYLPHLECNTVYRRKKRFE